jgi:hypothetical protein
MGNDKITTAFLAILKLYLKMTTSEEHVVTDEEVDMLLANVDRSHLSIFFINNRV